MSIYRRGDMWWVYISNPHKGGEPIRCSARTADRKQAQEYHDLRKARVWREVKLGEGKEHRWDEAARRWIEESTHKRSLSDDRQKLEWFGRHFAGKSIRSLTSDVIRETVESGKKEASPATRNRYYALLRAILRRAVREWKWIEKEPFLRAHREPERRIRYLTSEEAGKLLNELPMHLRDVVLFALSTGLRMRNVTHLRWKEVLFDHQTLLVERTKNGESQGVALNDVAMDVLRRQVGMHSERVFTYKGQPLDKANTQAFKKALKRAGIEDFRFHDLRHTWASWLAQNGAGQMQLQEMGGWKQERMVRRYVGFAPAHLRATADIIGRLVQALYSQKSSAR